MTGAVSGLTARKTIVYEQQLQGKDVFLFGCKEGKQ